MLYYATRHSKKRPGCVLDGVRQPYASFLMLDGHVLEKMCRQLCLTVCIYIGCGYGMLGGCISEKALYAVLDGIRPLQLLFAGA